MEKSEKIRHRPLVEAVKLLAYETSMQNNPLLLLFLQNFVESFETQRVVLGSLQKDVEDLWRRCGQFGRTIEKLRVQREG